MKSELLDYIRTLTLSKDTFKILATSSSCLELADKDLDIWRQAIVDNKMSIGKTRAIVLNDINLDDAFVLAYLYLLHYRVSTSITWLEMEKTRALVTDLYLSCLTINQF